MNIRKKIFGGADAVEEPILKPKKPRGAKADTLDSVAVPREETRKTNHRLDSRHRLFGETWEERRRNRHTEETQGSHDDQPCIVNAGDRADTDGRSKERGDQEVEVIRREPDDGIGLSPRHPSA